MSIDNNVGALHKYLSKLSTSLHYNKVRKKIYDAFHNKGYIGEKGKGAILRFNNAVKSLISHQQNIFEGLNIRYFGPFDGHDVLEIVKTLREIKEMKGPRLLHLHTIKGKGFPAAEKDPTTWHAPGKFNPDSGVRKSSSKSGSEEKWQDVFGDYLVKLAGEKPSIVGITAAMPTGTSMSKMLKAYPERTFDVGISEGHAVTFAGGLAAAGKHPFVAIYSSFLQRAYDNIIHDTAIQNLPVTYCIDRAGLVGEDGVTHHGLFDLVYLRCIPNMMIASPMDAPMLRSLMLTASEHSGPMAIRYPRGNAPAESGDESAEVKPAPVGKGRCVSQRPESKAAILSIGEIGNEVAKAAKQLADENINVDHFDMIWLKPLDNELLEEIISRYDVILTLEDGVKEGGFGSAVGEWINEHQPIHSEKRNPVLISVGVPDKWMGHGSVAQLRKIAGIDAESIAETLKKCLKELDL